MGDLREELLKAGLIDEATARRRGHDRRASGRRADGSPRASTTQRQLLKEGSDPSQIVRRGMVRPGAGPYRFHFVDRFGRMPFLTVDDQTQQGLRDGLLAIVETQPHGVAVVRAEAARALLECAPEMVRFWNRPNECEEGEA